MKIRIWHIALFVVALAIFAVAFAPASLLAPQRPGMLTYARAQGTVWNGRLEDIRLAGYEARAASWRLLALDLIQGKARVPIDFEDGSIQGRAMLLANVHNDRRLFIPNLHLDGLDLGARGRLPGGVSIRGLDIMFDDGVCAAARGRVESDVLTRAGQTLGWPGPPLEGRAACDGEDARILLAGANELGERVAVRIVLRGDGAGSWRLSVQTTRPETQAALAAAGFTQSVVNGELGYGEEMRWLP